MLKIARRFRNLLGIPSYHHDPFFAQEVRRAFNAFQPTTVALELPACAEAELAWAATCWPAPVVSISDRTLLPFVPGDSIFEAYRAAREQDLDVHLIDLHVDGDPPARDPVPIPGPEFAPRLGPLFLETCDAVLEATRPPTAATLAREACMARHLDHILRAYHRVLWVGGAAHWPRIIDRLEREDFDGPVVNTVPPLRFAPARLASSALAHATGRIPALVERYASNPARYDEAAAIRAMALEALRLDPSVAQPLLVDARSAPPSANVYFPEPDKPIDVVQMLRYARNLAATARVGERPSLGELLTAASAVIGNRYAARLYFLAMAESTAEGAKDLEPLTYECVVDRRGVQM